MSETYAPNQSNYFIGRGALYVDIHTAANVRTSYFHWGNVEDLQIVPSSQVATLRSSLDASSGVLAEDEISKDFEVRWRNTECNRKVLAAAIAGTEAYFTQSSSTVTAETLTSSVELGGVYKTAKRAASSIVVKQGASTLVLGTDYEVVDATACMIHILPTSSTVTAGSAITVDYSAAAVSTTSQKIIQGGNRAPSRSRSGSRAPRWRARRARSTCGARRSRWPTRWRSSTATTTPAWRSRPRSSTTRPAASAARRAIPTSASTSGKT
jgi:hypothetical protein